MYSYTNSSVFDACPHSLPAIALKRKPRRSFALYAAAVSPSQCIQDSQINVSLASGQPAAVSQSEFEAATLMFTVPEAHWLNLPVVQKSPIGALVSGEAPWVQLALYLIYAEAAMVEPWDNYLTEFSASPNQPLVIWSEEELAQLQGTQVLDSAQQYRAFFAGKHKALEATVLPSLDSTTALACTLDKFMLAASAVRARLYAPFTNEEPCLVGGVELLQHSRKPNVQLQVKGGLLFDKRKSLQVVAISELATAEPLTINFLPNKLESQVALDYGVYDHVNPQAGYMLTLSLPTEDADTSHFDKLDIVELQGLQAAQQFTLSSNQQPPSEMLAFLRLSKIDGPDRFLMESIFRNEAWEHLLEPLSEENERGICGDMVAACEGALNMYPTTLAEDIKALGDIPKEDVSKNRLSLQIRMEEKRTLEGLAEWFRQRLEILGALDYYHERRLKRLGLMDDDGGSTFEDMIKINV